MCFGGLSDLEVATIEIAIGGEIELTSRRSLITVPSPDFEHYKQFGL